MHHTNGFMVTVPATNEPPTNRTIHSNDTTSKTYNSVETVAVDIDWLDHADSSLLRWAENRLGSIGEAESAHGASAEGDEDKSRGNLHGVGVGVDVLDE
jgi:hypothetical protein